MFSKFRYTQKQRTFELGFKSTPFKPRRIREIEESFFHLSRKSSDFGDYLAYCRQRARYHQRMTEYYSRPAWRRMRFLKHIRQQKSEQKMLNRFEAIYGGPDSTVVAYGDWSSRRTMKYQESTMGVGLRSLFKKRGYSVYLVDEFKTSKQCFKCKSSNGVNEKFFYAPHWKKEGSVLCHGLLRCTSCGTLWNRDLNSACNIHYLANEVIKHNNPQRPAYLSRAVQQ